MAFPLAGLVLLRKCYCKHRELRAYGIRVVSSSSTQWTSLHEANDVSQPLTPYQVQPIVNLRNQDDCGSQRTIISYRERQTDDSIIRVGGYKRTPRIR
jgi:hypothetical protein